MLHKSFGIKLYTENFPIIIATNVDILMSVAPLLEVKGSLYFYLKLLVLFYADDSVVFGTNEYNKKKQVGYVLPVLYLAKCNSIYGDKTLYLKFPVLLYANNTVVFTKERFSKQFIYVH